MFGKVNQEPDASKCLRLFFESLVAYPKLPKTLQKFPWNAIVTKNRFFYGFSDFPVGAERVHWPILTTPYQWAWTQACMQSSILLGLHSIKHIGSLLLSGLTGKSEKSWKKMSFGWYSVLESFLKVLGGPVYATRLKQINADIWRHQAPDWLQQTPTAHDFIISRQL